MSKRTRNSLEKLVVALDDAIDAWAEYTGPCHGDCLPDWLCQQLPAVKRLVEGALFIAPEGDAA